MWTGRRKTVSAFKEPVFYLTFSVHASLYEGTRCLSNSRLQAMGLLSCYPTLPIILVQLCMMR